MGFLQTLKRLLFPPRPVGRYYEIKVKCGACGEILTGRVDLYNDLSLDPDETRITYSCRKVLSGSGQCHRLVEVLFTFDERRNPSDRKVTGGEAVA